MNGRLEKIRAWYAAQSERDQRAVLIGGAGLAVALVIYGVTSLTLAVRHANERVRQLKADVAYVESALPVLRATPTPSNDGEPLVALIDRTTRDAGLNGALRATEPVGDGGVRVRLEDAPFAPLAAWLARLARDESLSVENATIEHTESPGRVTAALVLMRR